MADLRHWSEQLRPLFDGRRVLVRAEVAAGALPTVRAVRELGARDVLVVALNGSGTGPLPTPDEARWISYDVRVAGDAVEAIHASNEAARHPPAAIVEEVDGFDPDHTAIAVGDFLNEVPDLCGRPFLAYRRPEWLALDDKTVVDALWDRCGMARAPSEIVAATTHDVRDAMSRLDTGDGVVVNADASKGWTGGGSGVRWVREEEQIDGALTGWTGPGRRVRVMPFLEGIPCSIHGIVLRDDVIVLRPVEMVTLRRPDGSFFYAGCATFWDPPESDREQMRATARVVGARLREEVSFRGAFTIDGVKTVDGFRPTELNPRSGAGLNVMTRSLDLPLQLLLDAIVAGVDADWRPRDLERELLAHADSNRTGGTWRALPGEHEPLDDQRLVLDRGVACTYLLGPSAIGTFVRAVFEPDTYPAGEPAGPIAAEVWAELDRRHALGVGPLASALPR